MQNEYRALISKIKLLEAENTTLSERAEDTILFGLAAETIYQTEDSVQMIDQMLERISVLKNLPFCGCFENTDQGLSMVGFYSSFSQMPKSEVQIFFPEIANKVPIDKGFVIVEEPDFESIGFSYQFPNTTFRPTSALIITCNSESFRNRFLIFLDDCKTENRFPKMLKLLQQIVRLAAERLKNIFMFGELTRLNSELDRRVKERTKELSKTNKNLRREIFEREIIEKALSANESKLRSVYDAAIDVSFITVDLSENIIIRSFSPGAEKMFGYLRGEVIGKPLELFQISNYTELFPSIQNDFDDYGRSRREEIILRRKSGEYFNAILTVYPLFSEDPKPVEALAVCIDISELKQTQNDLIRAREKAEENDRLKTAFLQNMSHEIRTPMNAIMGFSDLLPHYFGDQKKLIKYTDIIKERGADLLEIINDILDIARIESGQLAHHPEVYKMSLLFSEIETFFHEYQNKLNNNELEFVLKVSHQVKSFEVIIDRVKLKQILINLIGNAFKFTASGKIELGCSVNDNNEFVFYVSDTGIGISKEKHIEIFSRFTQADRGTSRLYGGTGLGLSIVQGLLDLMGGKIWLESEKGQGSTFWFSLPCQLSNKSVEQLGIHPENQKFDADEVKILIVEDDEYNSEYLKEILSETNFSFIHTRYGQKAVEICSEQPIHLVLMDIRLPDINGYEATKLIKQTNPEIKIIVQTAYATLEDKEKAINAGCDDYVSKPIKQDHLYSRIAQYL